MLNATHRLMMLAACAILAAGFSQPSTAQVYNPANGHYYARVDAGSILWPQAKDAAATMTFNGIAGHLATITSQAENDFIVNNLGGPEAVTAHWLGGYQDHGAPDYSESAGGWRWITGEPWAYTNWAPGEPNGGTAEDYLEFASFVGSPHDKWNDYLNAFPQNGYIVEFESPSLLVVDSASSRIMRLDGATGATIGEFVPPSSGHVFESIVFGPDGNLYAADWLTGSVHRYNGSTGSDMGLFVPNGSGGLSNPDQLAFGPDGNLYVSDRFQARIYKYNGYSGAPLGVAVEDYRLNGFIGFTFGRDGNIYAGTFNGARQILRFNSWTGAFMNVFYEDNATDGAFAGMTLGPDGDLYAARYHRGEVIRLNGVTGQLKQVFHCDGQTRADYVAMGPDGLLYTTELEHNTVIRYDPITGVCAGPFGSVANPTGLAFMVPYVQPAETLQATVLSVRRSVDRYGVTFRLVNNGATRVEKVKVIGATLGVASASSQLPMTIKGDLLPGQWVDIFVAFPMSAGGHGDQVTFSVNGIYIGTGSGIFSHSETVTLP